MTDYPEWLRVLAWFYIALSIASSLIIAFDVTRHRQKMWIMEPVWVISALYFSLVAVYWYLRTRPALEKGSIHPRPDGDSDQTEEPKPIQVAVATLHCGAGCALGDIIAENLVPAFGWQFAGEF